MEKFIKQQAEGTSDDIGGSTRHCIKFYVDFIIDHGITIDGDDLADEIVNKMPPYQAVCFLCPFRKA